jgi:hypothetical protein
LPSPPTDQEWEIRFRSTSAVKGWTELARQAPGNTSQAWQVMRHAPGENRSRRHKRLKGALASRVQEGQPCPVWQYEVTAAARIWYLIDAERHTVWLIHAGTGHPKATE